MMPESPNSNSGKYDFLLLSERLYDPWYASTSTPAKFYFVIFVLRSNGVFEQIYKSYFFDAIGTVPWGSSHVAWKETEEYKSFKGKKYLELISQGWKPLHGHELEFHDKLYKQSYDPEGKTLDELESMLRQMLLIRDRSTVRLLAQLGEDEKISDGEKVFKSFIEMIVDIKRKVG